MRLLSKNRMGPRTLYQFGGTEMGVGRTESSPWTEAVRQCVRIGPAGARRQANAKAGRFELCGQAEGTDGRTKRPLGRPGMLGSYRNVRLEDTGTREMEDRVAGGGGRRTHVAGAVSSRRRARGDGNSSIGLYGNK